MSKPTKLRSVLLFLIAALSLAQRSAAQDALLSSPAAAPVFEAPLPLPAPAAPLYAPVIKTSPTLTVAGITAGLVALDEHNMKYFRASQSFSGFNRVFSGSNTSLGMEVFPAAFYIIGLARKDSYAQHTVLLAGEAVLDSEILTTVMKDADRRFRPASVPPNGDFSQSWFKESHGSYLGGVGSFPSGHAIAAFSIATVFANRYPNPRWHVWLAYGLASLVGFSRVPLQSHFPSDVFAGAALGYAIAHFVVIRPRSSSAGQDAP